MNIYQSINLLSSSLVTFLRDGADHEAEGDEGDSVAEEEHVEKTHVRVVQHCSAVDWDPEQNGVERHGNDQENKGSQEP